MSKNINQVYIANPITSNLSTDLMYFGRSPYGATDDTAMTYGNFSAQFGAPYTAAALTKTNDTNVTLTLGGTPTTALLHATSMTLGWTGTLSGARGGTGVANSGLTINLGTATTGYVLTSDVSGNASWAANGYLTGAVLLSPAADQTILNGHNLIVSAGGAIQASSGNIIAGSSGHAGTVQSFPGTSSEGELVLAAVSNSAGNFNTTISNASSVAQSQVVTIPDAAQSTANFALAPNALVSGNLVAASGTAGLLVDSGIPSTSIIQWHGISGTTQAAAVNSGYVVQNSSQTTITLPATAALGSVVSIRGLGAAGWILAANTGQVINLGNTPTSSGGSLTSSNLYDSVDVTCIVADTTWLVSSVISTELMVA